VPKAPCRRQYQYPFVYLDVVVGSSTVRGSGLCTTVCTERGHGCDVQIIVINENNVMVSSVLLMFNKVMVRSVLLTYLIIHGTRLRKKYVMM